ncbi:arsenical pump-driving ATPase [Alteribacter lacisalsi]|uniref:Arsenical pump-driving ATPase n=1 Tax=Alteribacter lacisalsi TaxID=2045244 RepID=A0A2W0HCL1_9BACI|nr:arsenical pump-driving ATPase [Alteribacter lacisalsi]PYZ98927.1 arsenical pump-driving ATPase [Alteribacter lacisalsi]
MTDIFTRDTIPETPFLFFTGKGGVGKTSAACAVSTALADAGRKVLLVSTDPASNLDDVFGIPVGSLPAPVEGVSGLDAVNIDPEAAAEAYRDKVVGPYRDQLPAPVVNQMEEQLSGACTVEIAAFDQFAALVSDERLLSSYDHIVFDTAPTGHTLRLLQLPAAWSGFLDESTHGASCLGPLAGLEAKKALYKKTVNVLADGEQTSLILVARPDQSSLKEAARAGTELAGTGLKNQVLLLNGVFEPADRHDPVAGALYEQQREAVKSIDRHLATLPQFTLPLVSYSLTGAEALRSLLRHEVNGQRVAARQDDKVELPGVEQILNELRTRSSGVIMTMGKGGVGKTVTAAAIAAGLVRAGKKVHLTTTDPADHISHTVLNHEEKERMTVSAIDPEKVTEAYKQNVLARSADSLDEAGLKYLQEDLESPCTEEIAVFQAFADVVGKADDQFVVIDTAPTGHTLLLLDASQSYQKEVARSSGDVPKSVEKLLPRLRNAEETFVAIVTLPEATPVLEAERLEKDLKRAGMMPAWWIVNQSMAATETTDALMRERASYEWKWIDLVMKRYAGRTLVVPWLTNVTKLQELFTETVK